MLVIGMSSNLRLCAKRTSEKRKSVVDKLKRILPSNLKKIRREALKSQPLRGKPSACRLVINKSSRVGFVECKSSNDRRFGGAFTWSKHKDCKLGVKGHRIQGELVQIYLLV